MTAWHGLKARVRRQWALLSFTRSIPIHEVGEQPRFRQTFVLPSSFFFLLLFFSFFFFGTVSSESEPPFRAAIYVSSSFALCNSLYERVDGNYFSFIYVSLVSLFERSNVLEIFREIGQVWGYSKGIRDEKFSPENLNSRNAMQTELFPSA